MIFFAPLDLHIQSPNALNTADIRIISHSHGLNSIAKQLEPIEYTNVRIFKFVVVAVVIGELKRLFNYSQCSKLLNDVCITSCYISRAISPTLIAGHKEVHD